MILTWTMGVSTDDPISNYGFSLYDEGVTGYPGAPFGAVSPAAIAGYDVIYLAFGPSVGGFIFYLYVTDAGLAPPPDFFETLAFTDDDDLVWHFDRTSADFPDGQEFTFGPGDVRAWQWTIALALPVVTPSVDYAVSIDEPEPPDSGGGDSGGGDSGGDSGGGGGDMFPPIYDVCAADAAVLALIPDERGGVRLYPFGEAPQNDPQTYAVWQIVHGEPADNSLSCTPALDFYGVQVDVYGYTAEAARTAAQALRNAIETAAYVVAYRGESRDPATQAYRVSFLSEWHTPRA